MFMMDNCSGYTVWIRRAGVLTKKLTHELNAQRPIGFGTPPAKTAEKQAVDKWTVRAIARTSPLAVDNAAR